MPRRGSAIVARDLGPEGLARVLDDMSELKDANKDIEQETKTVETEIGNEILEHFLNLVDIVAKLKEIIRRSEREPIVGNLGKDGQKLNSGQRDALKKEVGELVKKVRLTLFELEETIKKLFQPPFEIGKIYKNQFDLEVSSIDDAEKLVVLMGENLYGRFSDFRDQVPEGKNPKYRDRTAAWETMGKRDNKEWLEFLRRLKNLPGRHRQNPFISNILDKFLAEEFEAGPAAEDAVVILCKFFKPEEERDTVADTGMDKRYAGIESQDITEADKEAWEHILEQAETIKNNLGRLGNKIAETRAQIKSPSLQEEPVQRVDFSEIGKTFDPFFSMPKEEIIDQYRTVKEDATGERRKFYDTDLIKKDAEARLEKLINENGGMLSDQFVNYTRGLIVPAYKSEYAQAHQRFLINGGKETRFYQVPSSEPELALRHGILDALLNNSKFASDPRYVILLEELLSGDNPQHAAFPVPEYAWNGSYKYGFGDKQFDTIGALADSEKLWRTKTDYATAVLGAIIRYLGVGEKYKAAYARSFDVRLRLLEKCLKEEAENAKISDRDSEEDSWGRPRRIKEYIEALTKTFKYDRRLLDSTLLDFALHDEKPDKREDTLLIAKIREILDTPLSISGGADYRM